MSCSLATQLQKENIMEILNILSSPSVSVTPLGSGFRTQAEVLQSGEKSSQTEQEGCTRRTTELSFSEETKITVRVEMKCSSLVSVKLLESQSETPKETRQETVLETVECRKTPATSMEDLEIQSYTKPAFPTRKRKMPHWETHSPDAPGGKKPRKSEFPIRDVNASLQCLFTAEAFCSELTCLTNNYMSNAGDPFLSQSESPKETVLETVECIKTPATSIGDLETQSQTEPALPTRKRKRHHSEKHSPDAPGGKKARKSEFPIRDNEMQTLYAFPTRKNTKPYRQKHTPKAPGGKLQSTTEVRIRHNQMLPIGLHNFMNNCYVNASLQCLFTAEAFCSELTCLMNNYMSNAGDPFLRYFVDLHLAKFSPDHSDMRKILNIMEILNILSSPSVSVTPLESGFRTQAEVLQSGEKSSQTEQEGCTRRTTELSFSEETKITVRVEMKCSSLVSVKLLESQSETPKETRQETVLETVECRKTPATSMEDLETQSQTEPVGGLQTAFPTRKRKRHHSKKRSPDAPGGKKSRKSEFPIGDNEMQTESKKTKKKTKPYRHNHTPKAPGGKLQSTTEVPIRVNQMLPIGLHNFMNNCYVNASLQCLFAAEAFCLELTCLMNNYMSNAGDPFLRYFVELHLAKFSPDYSDMRKSLLFSLIALAGEFNPEFTIYRQNDAHEFLCYCLSQMEVAGQLMGWQENIMPKCPIRSNFKFSMFKLLTCSSCGYQRESRPEIFNHLSVPLVHNSVSKCLNDLTNSLTQLEINCSKCEGQFAYSMNVFQSLPKFLLLQLNRFEISKDYTVVKLSNPVHISPELQLRCHPKMENSAKARQTENELHGSTCVYKITSILSHVGYSAHSGHYVTDTVNRSSHQWTTFDDEWVSPSNLTNVLKRRSRTSYVLLYERAYSF